MGNWLSIVYSDGAKEEISIIIIIILLIIVKRFSYSLFFVFVPSSSLLVHSDTGVSHCDSLPVPDLDLPGRPTDSHTTARV